VKTAEPLGSKSSDTSIRPLSLVDDARLILEPVASGLSQSADLAFAPDGRLFIAQHDATIRTISDGSLSEPAPVSDRWVTDERLLAIAVDPDFARTRFVFAIVASRGAFSVIRVREVAGTFGDRAVLLGGIRAGSEPAAALRFGPDTKLYAAFDDGGEARLMGDAASPNGKILRLNADGTTPEDQAGASPIYAAGSSSPAGLDWQPGTDVLWMADAAQGGITPVTAETTSARKRIRGVARASWRLPAAMVPTAMAFTRNASVPALAGNLFVASGTLQNRCYRMSRGHWSRSRPGPAAPSTSQPRIRYGGSCSAPPDEREDRCGLCRLPRAVALARAGAPVRHDKRAIVSCADFDPMRGRLVEIRDAVVREIAGAFVPRPMQLPHVQR
jgi:glucose/arabinose dehydrogenase